MKKIVYSFYQNLNQWYFKSRLAHRPKIHTGFRAVARVTINPIFRLYTRLITQRKGLTFPVGSKHQLIMALGVYEPEVVAICRQKLQPGMIVIDAGAYAGYYTLLFSELVGAEGKVYAFEPHPENIAAVRHNIRNSRYPENIVVVPKAVSNQVGSAQIYQHQNDTAKTSLYTDVSIKAPLSITATTIDAFLSEQGISKIDLIKLDIEGAEQSALDGMQNLIAASKRLMLIVECSPEILTRVGSTPAAFIAQLHKCGFMVSVIGEKGELVEPETALMQAENNDINLFCEKR
jgi:FkbM family methyltransferase